MKKYAQIVKRDMKVNLVGGNEVGLPIDHPAVICVDIGDKQVEEGMSYDIGTEEFYWKEERAVLIYLTDTEILQQQLTDIDLQNLEAQQERQLIAQQISDLELSVIEGGM